MPSDLAISFVVRIDGEVSFAILRNAGIKSAACLADFVDEGRRHEDDVVRGSSRFESLILSHHSRRKVACECNE